MSLFCICCLAFEGADSRSSIRTQNALKIRPSVVLLFDSSLTFLLQPVVVVGGWRIQNDYRWPELLLYSPVPMTTTSYESAHYAIWLHNSGKHHNWAVFPKHASRVRQTFEFTHNGVKCQHLRPIE